MSHTLILGDCLAELKQMPDNSVDLVFCSPPYEAARTYGIGFNLKGQQWVDWAVERYVECCRVSKGLVAWVVEGQTRKFQWSTTPALLMADLHRAGVKLRKPPIYKRSGIPGSGGPDWLRNDYEFIVCSSKGRLPWSDQTACGEQPKFSPGGPFSNREKSGKRVGGKIAIGHKGALLGKGAATDLGYRGVSGTGHDDHSITRKNGRVYQGVEVANPGNVIKCHGGGGALGSKLAHENEAPFAEKLAEFFIRSFCPSGGTTMDIFCGSGTTLAAAEKWGRNSIGIDIRQSQIDLTKRRLAEVQPMLNLEAGS